MKREILRLLLLAGSLSLFATGCYTDRYEPVVTTTPSGEVIVSQTPPLPRREVIGVAPSTSHVWIEGYWSYRHGRYDWVPGHWEVRPRPAAVYVPGHWDQTSRGWVWTPGRWQ